MTACTASLVQDTPMVDVSSLESISGGPELTVAALPKSGQIVLLEMSHRSSFLSWTYCIKINLILLRRLRFCNLDRIPRKMCAQLSFSLSLYKSKDDLLTRAWWVRLSRVGKEWFLAFFLNYFRCKW